MVAINIVFTIPPNSFSISLAKLVSPSVSLFSEEVQNVPLTFFEFLVTVSVVMEPVINNLSWVFEVPTTLSLMEVVNMGV